nr:myb/SANT-like domain-containing protein [Tanacetum cinerariifolium]
MTKSDQNQTKRGSENLNVSCFKTKQPSKEVQEAWEQLFEGLLIGGSVVVGLENPNVNLENVEIPNVNLKNVAINIDDDTEPIQGYMAKQEEKQEHIIKILESDAFGASKDDPYSVSRCMIVINGMVDEALMTDDNPLFYLAMDLFEDAVK